MTKKLMSMSLSALLLTALCACGSGGGASSSTQASASPDPAAPAGSSTSGDQSSESGSTTESGGTTESATGSGSADSGSTGSGSASTPAVQSGFPSSQHVFVVMLENQSFSQVFPSGSAGSCKGSPMPYLCGLAQSGGIATHFYANAHGSLRGYLFNTSGSAWEGKPWNCSGSNCSSAGVIKADNIVSALTDHLKSWRGYFEGMPHCGYMGSGSGSYTQHHNPFKWYSIVADSSTQQDNMCPFTQLATDLGPGGTLPNFGYIVPNEADDAEGTGSGSASSLLTKADNWIKKNVGPLLASPVFQKPSGDGILIVTFDEGRVAGKSGDKSSDNACSATKSSGCGGHVAFVVIGPQVAPGSVATATYHFQDMLHTMIHLLGLGDYMNGASTASDIPLFGN